MLEAVNQHLPRPHDPFNDLVPAQGIRLTPRHYAYLKISEGCNNKCSFCIIPSLRGLLASRPLADVMQEAERLVAAGVKELLVISQDTSAYGVDLRYPAATLHGEQYETRFVDLARALGTLGVWVRMHYVYPYPHVDDVLPLMADGRVLPYLDIPFQHGSPTVLKRMKRPAHAENTLERIHAWRSAVPDLTLRSSFIVGFPGETDAEFEELLDWMDEAQLDRVGCFKYSPVDGATANDLPDPVRSEVMDERYARFMETRRRHFRGAAGGEGRQGIEGAGRSRRWQRGHRAHHGRCAGDRWRGQREAGARRCAPANSPRVQITAAGTYDLAAEPILSLIAAQCRSRPVRILPG